jgi:Mg2+/citrate symporter
VSADRQAQEEFHEAINKYLEAQGYDDGLLTEWVLVTAQHMIPSDGEGSATALMIHVSRELPLYRSAGLIQYALVKTEQAIKR